MMAVSRQNTTMIVNAQINKRIILMGNRMRYLKTVEKMKAIKEGIMLSCMLTLLLSIQYFNT